MTILYICILYSLYTISKSHVHSRSTRAFLHSAYTRNTRTHPYWTSSTARSTSLKVPNSKGTGILPKSTIQNIHPAELMVDWIASECKEHQAQYHNITAKLNSIQYWYKAKQMWYSIISVWQYFDVPSMGKCIDRWYATCGGMKSNWHLSRHQTHDNENAVISSYRIKAKWIKMILPKWDKHGSMILACFNWGNPSAGLRL